MDACPRGPPNCKGQNLRMSQAPSPYEPSAPLPTEPAAGRSPASPKRKWKRWVIAAGLILLLPCGCCGGFAALMGRNFYVAVTERDDIQMVLDRFLGHMDRKEVPLAYALFSARARRQLPMSNIQNAVDGPLHYIYSNYHDVRVNFVKINSSLHSDQNKPQGTVAVVQGTVLYTDGPPGTLQATLEREKEGQWRLHLINVTRPPSNLNRDNAK